MEAQGIFGEKKALVIGGTGGIGREVALGLAQRGASVCVCGGSDRAKLDKTLEDLKRFNTAGHDGFLCKIGRDALGIEDAAAFMLEHAPRPDILVCAWGPFVRLQLADTGDETWRFLTESNLIFPEILISRVFRAMIEGGWGRILLFGGTGTAHIRGYLATAAYSAAKTALGVLAASVAAAADGRDITCNVICPGLTDTEYCGAQERGYNLRKSPGGMVMTTREIARAALAVLENPGINGAVLPVDRGIRL